MTKPDHQAPPAQLALAEDTDVCIIGAGLLGMFNAIQLAKRGLRVIIIDDVDSRRAHSYKVGESLLVYSNAFLRSVGELDHAIANSLPKDGIWMAYGLEGQTRFGENVAEWGFQGTLPKRWIDAVINKKFARTMYFDAQIVRPEIEEALRQNVRKTAGIVFHQHGHVNDVAINADTGHIVQWRSRDDGVTAGVIARWVLDCSGRNRFLAKRLSHDLPLNDGFATTAVWAQFSHCTDDLFDERWIYRFPDGDSMHRDRDTVHLWGDGYWIWLIRLANDRISVGVTFDRRHVGQGADTKTMFWDVLGRYPLLSFLKAEHVLEFQTYRNVQYLTDTYVSAQRYAMVGDAASIIDAYYSQGISLSVATSWHFANIVERDLAAGHLDRDYIDRVNRCADADWRIMRSMVKYKYRPAIADGRFFILDHLLDYMILGAALLGRFRMARWLVDTGGYTSEESPHYRRLRARLERQLFLSRSAPFSRVDPQRFANAFDRWHRKLANRAEWRLAHNEAQPPMKAALRSQAPIPNFWRLAYAARLQDRTLTPREIPEPAFMRLKGTETRPLVLALSGTSLLGVFGFCYAIDAADTALRRLRHRLTRGERDARRSDAAA